MTAVVDFSSAESTMPGLLDKLDFLNLRKVVGDDFVFAFTSFPMFEITVAEKVKAIEIPATFKLPVLSREWSSFATI